MDTEFYVKILTKKLYEMRVIEKKELQFDNNPYHKSKLAEEYLKKYKIATLKWFPYFPDLNPIKNIWGIMDRKLQKKYFNTIRVNWADESRVGEN